MTAPLAHLIDAAVVVTKGSAGGSITSCVNAHDMQWRRSTTTDVSPSDTAVSSFIARAGAIGLAPLSRELGAVDCGTRSLSSEISADLAFANAVSTCAPTSCRQSESRQP